MALAATAFAAALLGLVPACGSAAPARPVSQDGPPATAQVRDGQAADIDGQDQRSTLFANWDPFVDPEGRPVVYEWAIGTRPGTVDVMPWTDVGGSLRASTQGIELPRGVSLHVSVRATDLGGNRSAIATSDGVVIGERTERTFSLTDRKPAAPPVGHFAALDRHGISWTFDQPRACGQFVNGDWWVVGPVAIVAIAPPSIADGGRVRHGAMVNPDPTAVAQGYDSAMYGEYANGRYDPALNVALGVSRQRPLQLAPGTSLVSTISLPIAGHMPQLETCAVLTCLAAPPPAESFRPPYCGTDKTCRWTATALDLTRLASVAAVQGAPQPDELAERFERTWLDHGVGWTGRYLHPQANMPDYGREMADLVGQAALVLQLQHAPETKRRLAIGLAQLGIDCYGIVQNGGRFVADGGSGSGRKFPVLFAGHMLRDDALLACAKERKLAFAEDAQTFVVAETSPGVWNRGHGGYSLDDEGLPEWGNRHADDPSLDTKSWTDDPYRRCCTANAWCGFVLAARIMGLREAWGHDALFDYVDRYMQIEPRDSWTRAWTPFVERMWDLHRPQF
jgi:hypothetical protein